MVANESLKPIRLQKAGVKVTLNMVLSPQWQANDSITSDLPKPPTPEFPLKSYVL